jgi:hypothetical protein
VNDAFCEISAPKNKEIQGQLLVMLIATVLLHQPKLSSNLSSMRSQLQKLLDKFNRMTRQNPQKVPNHRTVFSLLYECIIKAQDEYYLLKWTIPKNNNPKETVLYLSIVENHLYELPIIEIHDDVLELQKSAETTEINLSSSSKPKIEFESLEAISTQLETFYKVCFFID